MLQTVRLLTVIPLLLASNTCGALHEFGATSHCTSEWKTPLLLQLINLSAHENSCVINSVWLLQANM
jgi:hypothetical protein